MDRCRADPARKLRGHSQASPNRPRMRLMICNAGTGFTAPSRLRVKKSQKIFGQKKPSMAAPTWSRMFVLAKVECKGHFERLTSCRCEHNQTRPVVLDQFAHVESGSQEMQASSDGAKATTRCRGIKTLAIYH